MPATSALVLLHGGGPGVDAASNWASVSSGLSASSAAWRPISSGSARRSPGRAGSGGRRPGRSPAPGRSWTSSTTTAWTACTSSATRPRAAPRRWPSCPWHPTGSTARSSWGERGPGRCLRRSPSTTTRPGSPCGPPSAGWSPTRASTKNSSTSSPSFRLEQALRPGAEAAFRSMFADVVGGPPPRRPFEDHHPGPRTARASATGYRRSRSPNASSMPCRTAACRWWRGPGTGSTSTGRTSSASW